MADGETATDRYAVNGLRSFAHALLVGAGLDTEMASVVADVLVEGDLLGHDTHGLALLASYLRELEAGTMTRSGSRSVIEQRKASATLGWRPLAWAVADSIGNR